jgi:thiol-disulfide isomerase/thioredoxin
MFLKRSLLVVALVSTQLYSAVTEINNLSTFNNKIKSGVSVVKFYMDNCPPCKASGPMFNSLSTDNKYNSVNFITVNFQRGRQVALKYARMFPTFAIFKDGKIIGSKIVGFDGQTKNQIMSRIDTL